MLMTLYVVELRVTAHVLTTFSGISASLIRRALSPPAGGPEGSY